MIRKATAADIAALCPRTTAGHKIHGLLLAYGADYDFLPFWIDDNGGFAACLSGCVMADVSATAADEWACFIQMLPQATQVETSAPLAAALADAFTFTPRPVLQLPKSAGDAVTPPLSEVYALEKAVFGAAMPPFAEWYADMSHRLRHGCGKAVGIYEGDALASAALVTLTTPQVGIIGGVATLPQSRGKGYARTLVSALAGDLQRAGKQALIIPKTPTADALYRRWGAVETDTLFCGERV